MDIIAAHQQGLIEQLDDEVAALAGRPHEHGQRAVVLHHLFNHSRAGHSWALTEAQRGLRIAAGLAALQRRLDRWGWMIGDRNAASAAVRQLATALGEAARARAAAAYRAYRLSATPSLRAQVQEIVPPELLMALDQCHAARRAGDVLSSDIASCLAEESEALAVAAADPTLLEAAWLAVDATGLRRAAQRLLGDKALACAAARDRRRGSVHVERQLRANPALPAGFRANPAQHFYALQHTLRERRRQQWREACDREPDAFELAA